MPHRHQTLTRFGLNVRRRREAIGLSQEALAEKADLDRTYISGIERGARNREQPLRFFVISRRSYPRCPIAP